MMTAETKMEKQSAFWTIADVAAHFGISVDSVYRLAEAGELGAKISGRWRFDPEEVRGYYAQRKAKAKKG